MASKRKAINIHKCPKCHGRELTNLYTKPVAVRSYYYYSYITEANGATEKQ